MLSASEQGKLQEYLAVHHIPETKVQKCIDKCKLYYSVLRQENIFNHYFPAYLQNMIHNATCTP